MDPQTQSQFDAKLLIQQNLNPYNDIKNKNRQK